MTANGKDRYTLLPGSPFSSFLKLQMAVFMKKSFRSYTYACNHFTQQHWLRKTKKEMSAKSDYQVFSFPEGTTSLHAQYKVGVACNAFCNCLWYFLDLINCRYTEISITPTNIYIHTYIYIYIYIYLSVLWIWVILIKSYITLER